MAKISSLVLSVLLSTAFASNASSFLAAPTSAAQAAPTLDSKVLDMTSATMEAELTKLMLGKSAFGATPMGGSVKQIENLLTKTMMPAVLAAHKSDQVNLIRLNNEIKKCGATKNAALKSAVPSKNVYSKNSRLHQKCRGSEAILYSSKKACLAKQQALYNEKVMKCKYFAAMSKKFGTMKDNIAIVKKAGAETTEGYIKRISSTICGNHIHGSKGQISKKGGWGGGLPNSMLDKYLKAKKACEDAKAVYTRKVKECTRKVAAYRVKKAQCNQFQGLMDTNSCKSAVITKDACESYSTCYYAKKKAFQIFEQKVIMEETDRKAEWRGLKRMTCLIGAFADGKVTNAEVDACKKKAHSTSHLTIKYPKIPPLVKCALPRLYPDTGDYKKKEFAPLPNFAKGQKAPECAGIVSMSTKPKKGSPKGTKCVRVALNGYYSGGGLVKITNGWDTRRSNDRNSCPDGTKLWAPRNKEDWRTFLGSAGPLRAPNWIIDVTRPQNGCGGCTRHAMNSQNRNQKSWGTSDGSPWWLRSSRLSEPNGDYHANCYLDLWHGKPRNENYVSFNDGRCNYHSKSYYCQRVNMRLKPAKGSPKSCTCSNVDLSGSYSPGALVKCEQCITVYRSTQKNSCPNGMKLFAPRSRSDWKTVLDSAGPLRAPHWIIDITRPQNGCGGCTRYSMKSTTPQQATWRTTDRAPWWLRDTRNGEPNGDYTGNCFLNLHGHPASPNNLKFNDHRCSYRSRSYYCQPKMVKKGPPKVAPKPKPKAKPKALPKPILPKGVRINYNQLTLQNKGWKVWSDQPYKHGTQLRDLQPTSGECIMWGSKRSSGTTTLSVAAFGRRTAIKNKRRVWENGVYWYTNINGNSGSAGFAPNGVVSLNSADTNNSDGSKRLSWHVYKGRKVGGYRSGNTKGLNSNGNWRKIVMYGPCKGVKGGK